jgi:hypothetical protein
MINGIGIQIQLWVAWSLKFCLCFKLNIRGERKVWSRVPGFQRPL